MSLDLNILDFSNKDLRTLVNEPQFEVDSFLHSNYRFESIDLLLKELNTLNKDLNAELIDLINSNFDQFIKLSLSLDGSSDLLNAISHDLSSFDLKLQSLSYKFSHINQKFGLVLQLQSDANLVKFKINLVLLASRLITNIDNLLILNCNLKHNAQIIRLCKNVINLILNVSRILKMVSHPLINVKKFKSLLFEFKSYLDNLRVEGEDKFEVFKIKKVLASVWKDF